MSLSSPTKHSNLQSSTLLQSTATVTTLSPSTVVVTYTVTRHSCNLHCHQAQHVTYTVTRHTRCPCQLPPVGPTLSCSSDSSAELPVRSPPSTLLRELCRFHQAARHSVHAQPPAKNGQLPVHCRHMASVVVRLRNSRCGHQGATQCRLPVMIGATCSFGAGVKRWEDGSTLREDGSTLREDGSTRCEDSSTRREDSSTRREDGTTLHEDGTTQREDGSTLREDGSTLREDGSTLQEGGSTLWEDGSIQSKMSEEGKRR